MKGEIKMRKVRNPYQGIFSVRRKNKRQEKKIETITLNSKYEMMELARVLEPQFPIKINLEFE